MRKIGNFEATKQLKALIPKRRQKKRNKREIAACALETFSQIEGEANQSSTRSLLLLLLRCGQGHQMEADSVWDALCKLSRNRDQIRGLFPLLLFCLAQSSQPIEMAKFAKIVGWMAESGRPLTDWLHSGQVAKIMSGLRNAEVGHLRYLERLMAEGVLGSDEFVKGTLLKSYAALDEVWPALKLFDSLDEGKRSTVAINLLLAAMLRKGHDADALAFYSRFAGDEALADEATHSLAIRACASSKSYEIGKRIHSELRLSDDERSLKLKTQLVDFFGVCGDLENAQLVFDSVGARHRDAVCVGAMLKALVGNSQPERALRLFDSLPSSARDGGIHVLAIKACAQLKNAKKAEGILAGIGHSKVRESVNVVSALIDCFGQCGLPHKAQSIFSLFRGEAEANIACLNAMMAALSNNGHFEAAMAIYDAAKVEKSARSHVLALTACARGCLFEKGEKIRREVWQSRNVQTQTALIAFCGAAGDLRGAKSAFDRLSQSGSLGTVSVNAMMTALARNECNAEALRIYEGVTGKVAKDETTHALAIRACAELKQLQTAKRIFFESEWRQSVPVSTAMIQCFGQCGDVSSAKRVFFSLCGWRKSKLAANAMMSALVKHDFCDDALGIFDSLPAETRDADVYRVAIRACSRGNQLEKGQQLQAEIEARGIEGVETHLVGMFAKCGKVGVAEAIFDAVPPEKRSIALWNELINARLANSDIVRARELFERMDVAPDRKTLSLLLNGCSMLGDVESARRVWHRMEGDELKWDCVVIGCIVDCCARSGRLFEGFEWICRYERAKNGKANKSGDYAMWMALLAGCRERGNALLARFVYFAMAQRGFGDAAGSKHRVLLDSVTSET